MGWVFCMLQYLPEVWLTIWHSIFTCMALLAIAVVLQQAGCFRWLGLHLARSGSGWGRVLVLGLGLLAVVVTAVLSHYGAALVVMPMVLELISELAVTPAIAIATAATLGFAIHVASLILPISSLVNLMAADTFDISFGRYALVMVPVGSIAIATSLGVLWFYFQQPLAFTYNRDRLTQPNNAIHDAQIVRYSFMLLFALVAGCFLASTFGISVLFPAGILALLSFALAGRWFSRHTPARLSTPKLARSLPWRLGLTGLGLYLVVMGLVNIGLIKILSQLLEQLADWGFAISILGCGLLAALLATLLNQLPAIWLVSLAIQALPNLDSSIREGTIYATIVGCGLGGAIAPFSSLASLTWLKLLSRKNLHLNSWHYIRLNLALALPILLVTLLTLILWLPWLHI